LSESASSYAFEQLEPSDPLPPGTPARIVAEAELQAAGIRELARGEGFAAGRAEGQLQGLAEANSAAGALSAAVTEIQALREEVAESVEHDAVELAMALAAKILSGALEVQPERVLDAVRGALRRVNDRRRITVMVDPADLDVVSSAITELSAQAGGIELCEVQSDRRVGRGGAIVRTVEGEVDASIETQLQRAREVVVAELQGDLPERP
jgi:flagellar assembly protein FliH